MTNIKYKLTQDNTHISYNSTALNEAIRNGDPITFTNDENISTSQGVEYSITQQIDQIEPLILKHIISTTDNDTLQTTIANNIVQINNQHEKYYSYLDVFDELLTTPRFFVNIDMINNIIHNNGTGFLEKCISNTSRIHHLHFNIISKKIIAYALLIERWDLINDTIAKAANTNKLSWNIIPTNIEDVAVKKQIGKSLLLHAIQTHDGNVICKVIEGNSSVQNEMLKIAEKYIHIIPLDGYLDIILKPVVQDIKSGYLDFLVNLIDCQKDKTNHLAILYERYGYSSREKQLKMQLIFNHLDSIGKFKDITLNQNGETPIHDAIYKGDYDIAKYMFACKNFDINQKDESDYSYLKWACITKILNEEFIISLISKYKAEITEDIWSTLIRKEKLEKENGPLADQEYLASLKSVKKTILDYIIEELNNSNYNEQTIKRFNLTYDVLELLKESCSDSQYELFLTNLVKAYKEHNIFTKKEIKKLVQHDIYSDKINGSFILLMLKNHNDLTSDLWELLQNICDKMDREDITKRPNRELTEISTFLLENDKYKEFNLEPNAKHAILGFITLYGSREKYHELIVNLIDYYNSLTNIDDNMWKILKKYYFYNEYQCDEEVSEDEYDDKEAIEEYKREEKSQIKNFLDNLLIKKDTPMSANADMLYVILKSSDNKKYHDCIEKLITQQVITSDKLEFDYDLVTLALEKGEKNLANILLDCKTNNNSYQKTKAIYFAIVSELKQDDIDTNFINSLLACLTPDMVESNSFHDFLRQLMQNSNKAEVNKVMNYLDENKLLQEVKFTDGCDEEFDTALHLAIQNENYESAELMLKKIKLYINETDEEENTYLHLACENTNINVDFINTLLNTGINLQLKNDDGFTALEMLKNKDSNSEDIKNAIEMIENDIEIKDLCNYKYVITEIRYDDSDENADYSQIIHDLEPPAQLLITADRDISHELLHHSRLFKPSEVKVYVGGGVDEYFSEL